eukprot:4087694-Pyramimonas_sp.AAC.1
MMWSEAAGFRNAGGTLFDIRAAFPSVARGWMWRVLSKMGLPDWFFTALRSMYADVEVVVSFRGIREHKFPLGRGMKQGCPLSGILFVL